MLVEILTIEKNDKQHYENRPECKQGKDKEKYL